MTERLERVTAAVRARRAALAVARGRVPLRPRQQPRQRAIRSVFRLHARLVNAILIDTTEFLNRAASTKARDRTGATERRSTGSARAPDANLPLNHAGAIGKSFDHLGPAHG